jgi:hypothetical protein
MSKYRVTAAIVGSAWADEAALEELQDAIAAAGATEAELVPGEHLVDVAFDVEAEGETEAHDAAHRTLLRAASAFGWMVIRVEER